MPSLEHVELFNRRQSAGVRVRFPVSALSGSADPSRPQVGQATEGVPNALLFHSKTSCPTPDIRTASWSMGDYLLAKAAGVSKQSKDFLARYGIDFATFEGGELLLVELHSVPETLKRLEREGYFRLGERHVWHVEAVSADAINVLVRHRNFPRTVLILGSNIISICVAPWGFRATGEVSLTAFSSVAKDAINARDGVPRLTRDQIEREAHLFVLEFGSTRLRTPAPTDLNGVVHRLSTEHGISFDFGKDLGHTKSGRKVLGIYRFAARSILIDGSLERGPRFAFTLAHELGHLYLHAHVRLQNSPESDDTRQTVNMRQTAKTPVEWIEWQANAFAAGVLMPAATVYKAVEAFQRELNVSSRIGTVYLDNQPFNVMMYRGLIRRLRELYAVSASVASIRLKTLGILQMDYRFEPRHLSEFLRAA